ncbi:MAG: GAF domain-containing protein [Anaerolineaceae bacterium]|nr:MAG: GAF domain-containing protein [Anaerolineaceae bacterium]
MTATNVLTEENRRLLQEIKRRTHQMAAINVVTSVVGQSLDLEKTLQTALDVALEIVSADASGISLIDEAAGELVLRAQRGWVHDFVASHPMRLAIDEGMSGEVLGRDDVVVYNNLTGEEDYAMPSFREEHFRSIAMAPMHARGRIIGVLSVMSNEPGRFDDDSVSVLRVVADTVGIALENARLYARSVEQRQRMEAILHATADGIIATDQGGKIVMTNYAAEQMLGAERDELLGIPLRGAPINEHIRNQLLRALASREKGEEKAFQATMKDERVIAVLVNPIVNDSQFEHLAIQDGWLIMLQDMTHIRRAELARARFMQEAGHDMRNPLSISYSSLITLDKLIRSRDGAIDEVLDLAKSGLERLQTIINDLLHLEHIESGYNFRIHEFNVLDVLHEIEHESMDRLVDRAITLSLELGADIPQIHADVRWFKRAVHNYIENAAKYTPSGESIAVRVFCEQDWLVVEIVDNGPGIPVNAQARIFDRFYRVQGDKSTGSGLGLAIVKGVAQAHGGDVYLRSRVGEGSVFGFRIPINPPEELRRDIRLPDDENRPPPPKLF